MTKTLALILNHNRREYTDRVYDMIAPYAGDLYDVAVFDNGSTDTSEISKRTTHGTDKNYYFGGGLNITFDMILDSPQYDSLLFMSNDIILHGYNYIKKLRSIMFDEDYALVSTSVIQPEVGQCFWKQMHNWGASETRQVRWVDFQCPLIRRDVIEKIGQYDMDLIYGWGPDVYTGVVCEENGWKVGVTDTLSTVHFSAQTTKDGKSDITQQEYSRLAEQGMYSFFQKAGKLKELQSMRNFGMNYSYKL